MKILEESPTRLKIGHKPRRNWWMGAGIAGATLAMILHFLILDSVVRNLQCDRRGGNFITCQLQKISLIGVQHWERLGDVQSVSVEERRSRHSTKYYITLSSPASQIQFAIRKRQTATVSQIQTFLNNPNSPSFRFQYIYSESIIVVIIFGILGAIAAIFLLKTPATTCSFYKTLQKVVIEKHSIFGTKEIEYPLEAIHHAAIEEEKSRNGMMYRSVLWLKQGETVQLHQDYVSSRASLDHVTEAIMHFLK